MPMNPTQQKEHRKRTDELEQMVTDLGTVVYDRIDKLAHHADAAVVEERRRRMELAKEQRSYVDDEIGRLRRQLQQFTGHSFYERLKWLLVGER